MEALVTALSVPLMLTVHWLYTLHRNRALLAVARARCAQSLARLRTCPDVPEGHLLVEALRWTQQPLLSDESEAQQAELLKALQSAEGAAWDAGIPRALSLEAGASLLEWAYAAWLQLRQLGGPMRLAGASAKQAAGALGLLRSFEHAVTQTKRLASA